MSTAVEPLADRVALVLRIGFRLAAGFLALGIAIALIRQEPLQREADSIAKIPGLLLHLRAAGFIDLAIVTIALTPLAAVIAICFGFRSAGEQRFARYSIGVLIVLISSIVLAMAR